MKEISINELEVVSGGFGVVGAVIGGVAAASEYIANTSATGQGSLAGLASQTAVGAAVGFFVPAGGSLLKTGAQLILANQSGMYTGLATGYLERAIDAAGTDYSGTDYN